MERGRKMTENSYKTPCGCIHYFVNIMDKQRITLVFLPGLTADHRLFEKQIEYFEKNQYGQQYKIFYKKTVKHFSLSNPADRHSFPERYDILSGKFLENYFFM